MSVVWLYPMEASVMAHAFTARAVNEVSHCRRYALTILELSEPADPARARQCKTCLKAANTRSAK